MGKAQHLLIAVRRTFIKSSCKTTTVLDVEGDKIKYYNNIATRSARTEEEADVVDITEDEGECSDEKQLTREDLAAIRIQASFRGHLARRAYRALKSLVKVQAVVRGVFVRNQARLAIHCMQAMVRLQVRVRARQLLSQSGGRELSCGSPEKAAEK